MATYGETSYVTKLELIEMFSGDTLTIPFEFYYDDARTQPIDLLEMDVEPVWTLCPYGQYDYPVLKKDMVIASNPPNLATVSLTIADTVNLKDIKYSHQPILIYTNANGTREYRRAEGDILIMPRIKYEII